MVKLNGLQESQVLSSIRNHTTGASALNQAIRRLDFAKAFDPIAAADESLPMAYLEPSVFDRSLEPIALDIAPFVRGIIAYETRLQKQRLKLSNLVSQGGRSAKRMRTTRAAMSALEGGSRSTTRKGRWFKANLNTELVLRTGGDGWDAIACGAEVASIRKSMGSRSRSVSTDFEDGQSDVDELA